MTNVINLQQIKEQKDRVAVCEVITLEKIKKYSNSDLLDHLQEAIDWLSQEELHSEGWNHLRNHIDDTVAILDERLGK
jgi:hypothetical protein